MDNFVSLTVPSDEAIYENTVWIKEDLIDVYLMSSYNKKFLHNVDWAAQVIFNDDQKEIREFYMYFLDGKKYSESQWKSLRQRYLFQDNFNQLLNET